MSNSKRKNSFIGNIRSASEKKDKQWANRKFRRLIHQLINPSCEDDALPSIKNVSNKKFMSKHEKTIIEDPKDLRK